MKSRKFVVALSLASLGVLSFAGCKSDSNPSSTGDTTKPVTDRNLVVNGNAENASGWAPESNAQRVKYGTADGLSHDGKFAHHGDVYYFSNHVERGQEKVATQTIDISSAAGAIDSGYIYFDISGYFGGYSTYEATTNLFAEFLDSKGNILPVYQLNQLDLANRYELDPVLMNRDRLKTTDMNLRSEESLVPPGTRKVRLSLRTYIPTPCDECSGDGYADDINFSLKHS